MPEPAPWWRPDVHEDRRPFLTARGRIRSAVRGWFEGQGFTEVEAAALQVSPGNEAHLHAFATEMATTDGQRAPLYLHTSPEFACKKLLAAGSGGTGSAGRCTARNSRCSNGTGRRRRTRP